MEEKGGEAFPVVWPRKLFALNQLLGRRRGGQGGRDDTPHQQFLDPPLVALASFTDV